MYNTLQMAAFGVKFTLEFLEQNNTEAPVNIERMLTAAFLTPQSKPNESKVGAIA